VIILWIAPILPSSIMLCTFPGLRMTPGIEVDCPSWNRLVHLDIDCNIHQDRNGNSAISGSYLVLVVFQRVVPSDKVKKRESLGDWILQKPLSHPLSVRRNLICLDIEDI